MPQKPIYEPEPLPSGNGASGITTGLTHSAYQRARINQIRQNVEAQPVSLPSAPRNRDAVEEGLRFAEISANQVRTNIRKQVLNARRPGLGRFIGPLPERVQGVIDAKIEEVQPLIRQIKKYTVQKYASGTARTPTPVPPKRGETVPIIKAQMQPGYQVKYPDTRPRRTGEEIAADIQRREESDRQRHLDIMKTNPDFVAVPKGGVKPIAPEGKEYAVAGPQQSHPDVGYHTYYKLVDKPQEVRTVSLAEQSRNKVEAKKAARVSVAESGVKTALSAAHAEVAAQYPEAHPKAIREELLGRLIMGHFPEVSSAHQALNTALERPVAIARHFDGHINSLTQGLNNDPKRQKAIKAQVELEKKTQGRAPSQEELRRYGGVEGDVDLDVVDKPKRSRRTSDPAYTAVARILAKQHWSSTGAGELAGQVKNPLTGEKHPTFEKTSHFKNPKNYMKKVMGIADPDYHIDSNHADLLRAVPTSGGDGDREFTQRDNSEVPTAPFKGFAAKYAVNPIGAALTATTKKPANKPSTVSSRVTAATDSVADLGRTQLEARRISRSGSTDGFNAGRGAQ